MACAHELLLQIRWQVVFTVTDEEVESRPILADLFRAL